MINGIGTDIIEINRIKEMKQLDRFVHKLLSPDEQVIYETFKCEKRKIEFLAGRWAVKEALYKALGDLCLGASFHDYVILNTEAGKPYLAHPKIETVHLSISHCENYATAFVIYENHQTV
ncbi:MAG TPA: holo-[acyl-carrier-protein] synthase [Firmicutes bacterium]|nr:holo-[acyl-carrier-protein] synthase [Bacillota bacterium]